MSLDPNLDRHQPADRRDPDRLCVLVADLIRPASRPLALAVVYIGLAITAALTLSVGQTPGRRSAAPTPWTRLTTFLDLLFISIAALTIAFAPDYLMPRGLPMPEFAIILVFAMTGAMIIAASAELLLLFIGLELMVLPGYLLAGYHKTRRATRPKARSSTSCWARSARRSSCSGSPSSGA